MRIVGQALKKFDLVFNDIEKIITHLKCFVTNMTTLGVEQQISLCFRLLCTDKMFMTLENSIVSIITSFDIDRRLLPWRSVPSIFDALRHSQNRY